MMDRHDLLDDPRFATPEARVENAGPFNEILIPWVSERTKQEIFHKGQKERVWLGPIYTVDELFNDPQYVARKHFEKIEHPVAGTLTYIGAPYKMKETPWQLKRPAPRLGEHNEEIYCGVLGYEKSDLVRLRESGII